MTQTPGRIEVDFGAGLDAGLDVRWARTLAGVGRLRFAAGALRLELIGATANHYSNAQFDDYSGIRASHYPWRPPLCLRVRARASHAAQSAAQSAATVGDGADRWLRGTAGFGFWNAPFTLAGGGLRLPEALWFFAASAPSQLALTAGGQPYGWKAQVAHARRPGALAAVPPLALTALWARVSGDDRPAAQWMERLTGASEVSLDAALGASQADLRQWRDYTLEWRPGSARFLVNGREALLALDPPRGPLGFVAWIDNQYAIVTPRGDLRFGALDCAPQWLEIASLSIEPLD